MKPDQNRRPFPCRLRRLIVPAAILCCLAAPGTSAAAVSVEDLLAAKDRWETRLGRLMVVEGRISTMKGKTIILQKCSQKIEFRSDRVLPEATGAQVAEVTGRLARDENTNRIFFEVTRVKLLPDDVTGLQVARRTLPKDEPDKWYALAEWAINRAKFYGKTDDPLYAESKKLYELAVIKERRLIKNRTPQALRNLAVKARRYGVNESIRMSMIHESYFKEWQNIRLKGQSGELLGLATTTAAALPGGSDPLAEDDSVLKQRTRYLDDPLKIYDETAEDAIRRQLHRIMYQQMVSDAIGKEEDGEGKNGKVIAKIITDYLPERIDEAKKYITAERNWRLKNVQTIPRPEMLALRQEFLDIGDQSSAAKALESWFEMKETELRRRGVDGLLDLATAYEIRYDIVDDEDEKKEVHSKVIALLMDAYRRNPGSGTTQNRLEGYGYRLRDGAWKTPEQMEQFRNTPRQRAMAEGRVDADMTNSEVIKSLGRPDRVTRILTAKSVIELWAYGAPDETPLVVRLVRTGNRKSSVVTHWKQLAVSAPAASVEEAEPESEPNVEAAGGFE